MSSLARSVIRAIVVSYVSLAVAPGAALAQSMTSTNFRVDYSAFSAGGTSENTEILTSPSFQVVGTSVGQATGVLSAFPGLAFLESGLWPVVALDGDLVPTSLDNCPLQNNPSQQDSDSDGIGDACETACFDGDDNDGDGLVDYPDDPGCQSTAADAIENPACDDGIDNDSDGGTDFDGSPPDAQCDVGFRRTENPQCQDGIDNDNDGLTDFPADPQCASALDDREGCGLGAELVAVLPLMQVLRRRRRRTSRRGDV